MQIKHNSWLYTWAFWSTSRYARKDTVDLCTLFWRSVLVTPAKLTLILAGVVFIGFGLVSVPFLVLLVVVAVVSFVIAMIVGTVKVVTYVGTTEVYRSFKDKYCPIYEVT